MKRVATNPEEERKEAGCKFDGVNCKRKSVVDSTGSITLKTEFTLQGTRCRKRSVRLTGYENCLLVLNRRKRGSRMSIPSGYNGKRGGVRLFRRPEVH